MYKTDQFDALLARAIKGALVPVNEDQWKADNAKSNYGNGWKSGLPDHPVRGPYQPSGCEVFDSFIAKLNPRIDYGAAGPRTSAMNDVALNAAMKARGSAWLDLPRDAAWVSLPNVDQFDNTAQYIASLTHELTHWAERHEPSILVAEAMFMQETRGEMAVGGLSQKASVRMGQQEGGTEAPDDIMDDVRDPTYVMAEMTAELGSILLEEATGAPDMFDAHVNYMQGYMGAIPPSMRAFAMAECADRAKTAVHNMLQRAV